MVKDDMREVHIVGGHHPGLAVRVLRAHDRRHSRGPSRGPDQGVHRGRDRLLLAALEARAPARRSTRLKAAGLQSMPGGGAEIFSPRLAKLLKYTGKADPDRWCEIHGIAHGLGLKTNATMLYGHVETTAERVDHMLRLRAQQDATGGFLTFVPLALPGRPPPSWCRGRRRRPTACARSPPSRLLLDNFAHIEAYWVTLGEETRVDRAALRRRRRQRHAGGRAHPAPVGRADARRRRRASSSFRMIRDAGQGRQSSATRSTTSSRSATSAGADAGLGTIATGAPTASASTATTAASSSPRRRLLEVGALANEVPLPRACPSGVVTFVIDTNPNYTNVCITDCQFCAFYRKPGDPEAWTLTRGRGAGQGRVRRAKGRHHVSCCRAATTPPLPLDYYLTLVRETRAALSRRSLCTSSPPPRSGPWRRSVEPRRRRTSSTSSWDAGQRTATRRRRRGPLRANVRQRIEPKKRRPRGLAERPPRGRTAAASRSTATMMYGHVETVDDLLDHFDAIRTLQDEHGGFTAFVPVVVQARQHPAREVDQALPGPERAISGCSPSPASTSTTSPHPGLVVLRGQADRPESRSALRRRRLGRHALRGERPQSRRLRQHRHRRRDRHADPRSRLPPPPSAPPNAKSAARY